MTEPTDATAPDVGVPDQYGTSESANFEDSTWTFKMQEDFRVTAGRYRISLVEPRLTRPPADPAIYRALLIRVRDWHIAQRDSLLARRKPGNWGVLQHTGWIDNIDNVLKEMNDGTGD